MSKERLTVADEDLGNGMKRCYIIDGNEVRKHAMGFYWKLKEYEDLEEQGLLLRLPCKVGDTVYVICECEECNKFKTKQAVFEDKVEAFLFYEDGLSIITSNHPINSRIGGLVFLTQSEAEEKLRELEGK